MTPAGIVGWKCEVLEIDRSKVHPWVWVKGCPEVHLPVRNSLRSSDKTKRGTALVHQLCYPLIYFYFEKNFIHLYWFQRKKYWCERNIDRLPPAQAPTADQTHNPGMCPDWESNPQPFSAWDNAPNDWVTPAGLTYIFRYLIFVRSWASTLTNHAHTYTCRPHMQFSVLTPLMVQ